MSRDDKGYEVEKSTNGKNKIHKRLQYKKYFQTSKSYITKNQKVEYENRQI